MPRRTSGATRLARRILVMTVAATTCGAPALAQPFRFDQYDFPNVRFPDARFGEPHLVIYDDGVLLASAAYRYSQRHHDSSWLVVTLSLAASDPLSIRREAIALVRPDGIGVPPATEREGRRDMDGVRRFLDERAYWPDTLSFSFPRSRIDRGFHRFDFGVDPSDRIPDRVLRTVARGGVRGDVFFVSPDGSWPSGVHALVVTVDDERTVRLPVLLQ